MGFLQALFPAVKRRYARERKERDALVEKARFRGIGKALTGANLRV